MSEKIKVIKETTKEILDRLKTKADVMVTELPDEIKIDIISDDSPMIIGARGQNLYSLEHLVRVIANKQLDEFAYINIDSAGYKEKRRRQVEELVNKAIKLVLENSEPFEFDAMNPSERKIVHTLCQPVDGITSESSGEGESRRVVIRLDK
jgi:spoIIIJ-associated protein